MLPVERLQNEENYTDYYQRSYNISKYLASMHQKEGANVLSVGHAGNQNKEKFIYSGWN